VPELPKQARRPLKIHPEPEAQLDRLVRSLERIAEGLEHVVNTIDAVVVTNADGELCLRMAKQ
jgi:hypothetical protein